jgi:hypothetical protein
MDLPVNVLKGSGPYDKLIVTMVNYNLNLDFV